MGTHTILIIATGGTDKMKLSLTIKGEGEAFATQPASELARILREVAQRIQEDGDSEGSLRDINGNRVGSFSVKR